MVSAGQKADIFAMTVRCRSDASSTAWQPAPAHYSGRLYGMRERLNVCKPSDRSLLHGFDTKQSEMDGLADNATLPVSVDLPVSVPTNIASRTTSEVTARAPEEDSARTESFSLP